VPPGLAMSDSSQPRAEKTDFADDKGEVHRRRGDLSKKKIVSPVKKIQGIPQG